MYFVCALRNLVFAILFRISSYLSSIFFHGICTNTNPNEMYAIAICWLNARTQKRTDFLYTILFFLEGVERSIKEWFTTLPIMGHRHWKSMDNIEKISKAIEIMRYSNSKNKKKIRFIVVMVVVSHQSPEKRKKLYHIIQSVVWMAMYAFRLLCISEYILYRDCSNRRLVAGLPSTFVFLARIKTVWVRFGFGVFWWFCHVAL